jgi:hypothetical protein
LIKIGLDLPIPVARKIVQDILDNLPPAAPYRIGSASSRSLPDFDIPTSDTIPDFPCSCPPTAPTTPNFWNTYVIMRMAGSYFKRGDASHTITPAQRTIINILDTYDQYAPQLQKLLPCPKKENRI